MIQEKNSQKIIIEQLSCDLEDLSRYLKDLWRFLPLPTLYANPLFAILDANQALENLFGLKTIELIGERVERLLGEKLAAKRILEELSQKKKIENKEIEVVTKEGKKIFNISANSRHDSEGNIIGYYFSFSNITALKELQEKLEEKVKKRTQELQERINELEKFYKLSVGRELKMVELKEEIKELKKKLEKDKSQP